MTCSTSRSSVEPTLHEPRADSPRACCCHSPSSISDVDFSRRAGNKSSATTSDKLYVRRDAESGDELEQAAAATGDRALASGAADINEVLAHRVSSSSSHKRKAAVDEDEAGGAEHLLRKKTKTDASLTAREAAESDCLPSDYEEGEAEDSVESSVSRGYDCRAADSCEPVGWDVTADVACSSESSLRRRSRRTLYIEYWSRTDECKERKWDHLDEIADKYGSAEEHIFATTLKGIEHWTLWHVKDLSHEQVKQYVENWIDANAPHVKRWNYDDNPERSIDIYHVHVYFQVVEGCTVLQERKVDDLVHELD